MNFSNQYEYQQIILGNKTFNLKFLCDNHVKHADKRRIIITHMLQNCHISEYDLFDQLSKSNSRKKMTKSVLSMFIDALEKSGIPRSTANLCVYNNVVSGSSKRVGANLLNIAKQYTTANKQLISDVAQVIVPQRFKGVQETYESIYKGVEIKRVAKLYSVLAQELTGQAIVSLNSFSTKFQLEAVTRLERPIIVNDVIKSFMFETQSACSKNKVTCKIKLYHGEKMLEQFANTKQLFEALARLTSKSVMISHRTFFDRIHLVRLDQHEDEIVLTLDELNSILSRSNASISECCTYLILDAAVREPMLYKHYPRWLEGLELDFFFPNFSFEKNNKKYTSIAIEVQGSQHNEDIDFFKQNDTNRLINQKARDKRKRELCDENYVFLIELDAEFFFFAVARNNHKVVASDEFITKIYTHLNESCSQLFPMHLLPNLITRLGHIYTKAYSHKPVFLKYKKILSSYNKSLLEFDVRTVTFKCHTCDKSFTQRVDSIERFKPLGCGDKKRCKSCPSNLSSVLSKMESC